MYLVTHFCVFDKLGTYYLKKTFSKTIMKEKRLKCNKLKVLQLGTQIISTFSFYYDLCISTL